LVELGSELVDLGMGDLNLTCELDLEAANACVQESGGLDGPAISNGASSLWLKLIKTGIGSWC